MSDFEQNMKEGNENGARREGFTPSNEERNRLEGKTFGTPGRTPRPRFNRSVQHEGYSPRPSYRNYDNNESNQDNAAFRPRYQGNDYNRNYQPRSSFNKERGFQPREGGYQRYEGGYQQRERGYRPRYNDGDHRQEGGYQPRQGGFRPRYNDGDHRQEGGYQPRQGGFRPRYNDGDHRQEGGYQPRQGGFRPRYNDGDHHQEGGYQNRQGGFRPGGYQNRPYQRGNGNFRPKNDPKRRIEYKEVAYDPNEPIRLNKFLANAGVCSRRDADKYILAGVVTVNGEVVNELGKKVLRSDEVKFHDTPIKAEKKVYVLLNKPKGYVTTSEDPQNRKTVMELVAKACPERIYPVGRLDRNTTGVLLFTNDGELASKLTHPKFLKKKIYHVFLDRNLAATDLKQIAEGVQLEDGEIHADAIEYTDEADKKQVGIEIHSGKNRIVRRIFESLGYHVIKLDRVYFAGLTKKNVKRGDWRYLTENEVNMLRMGAFE